MTTARTSRADASVNTCKAQLKSIYGKTGIGSSRSVKARPPASREGSALGWNRRTQRIKRDLAPADVAPVSRVEPDITFCQKRCHRVVHPARLLPAAGAVVLAAAGCGGGGSSPPPPPPANLSPTASAQASTTAARSADLITLDATDSRDTDGSIANYQWTQLAGPTITLSDRHRRSQPSRRPLSTGRPRYDCVSR